MGAEQSLIGGGLDADDVCVICGETGEKKLLKEQPIIMEEREVTRREFNRETKQFEMVTKKVKLPKEMPEVPNPDEIIENTSYQRLQPDGFIIDSQLPICTNNPQHYVHYTCLRDLVLQYEPSRKQLDEQQQQQQQQQAKSNSQLFEQLPGSQVIEGYKEDIEDIVCPECRAPLMSEVVNMIKKSSFYKEKRKKVVERFKNKETFYISMNRRLWNNEDTNSWVFAREKITNYEFVTNKEEFTENYNNSVKMNIPLFSGIENLSAEEIINAYNEGLVGFSAYIDDDNEVAELLYSGRTYDDSIETIKNKLLEANIQENVAEAISTISFNNRDDEIYPGSVKFVFDDPVDYTRLMNLIREEQFADAKELMFNYTMDNVEVNYENLMQKIEEQMEQEQEEQEQEEENDIYNFIETLRMHNIYDSLIRKGDHDEAIRLLRDYDVTSRNERVISRYRNALNINLYIDYANSPAYDPEGLSNDDKLEVMEQLDSIVNALGFPEDNLSKNSRIIEIAQAARDNEAIQNLKAMLFDYTIRGVQDVNYWFIYQVLRDDGETDKNMQDMIYMHWIYDDLIKGGEEAGTEDFIGNLEPPYGEEEQIISYRKALDIQPYIDYVNSAEYVHIEKDYVIKMMNELRNALGFTGVQQAGMRMQVVYGGQAGQYGGMWQRGGFFMTCS